MKNKKDVANLIEFLPFSNDTKDFVPEPKPAIKFVPDWYKAQPGSYNDEEAIPRHGTSTSTIKRCMPIFDAMTAGYILGAPCDIFLDATDPERLQWTIPQRMQQFQQDIFSFHSPEQYSNYPIDPELHHKQLLRIMPMWAIKTPPGYSALIMNPHHTDNSPLWAFSGIVDTDAFVTDGHMSFLVKKGFKGVIKQGTPILQVVPFRREPWEMSLMGTEESRPIFERQRLWLRSTFLNGYKGKFRSKKDFK